MLALGRYSALNLDGGGSTEMVRDDVLDTRISSTIRAVAPKGMTPPRSALMLIHCQEKILLNPQTRMRTEHAAAHLTPPLPRRRFRQSDAAAFHRI